MAGTQTPAVQVVVLNWRTPELSLNAADAALRELAEMDGGVTIVDNDSGDGSFERIRAEAAVRGWPADRVAVVQSGWNGGFGAGNNHGIRQGLPDGRRPDLVYLLNSDAFPAPDAVQVLLDHMLAHPQTGMAGSYIHGPEGDLHTTCFRFPSVASEFEGAAVTGPIAAALTGASGTRAELAALIAAALWAAGIPEREQGGRG